jgi:hypothetical protein
VAARADDALAAPVRGTFALQVGRIGLPLAEWPAELAAGTTWRQEITLPINANFVGLRASDALHEAVTDVWFEPLEIRDEHARRRRGEVLAARRYGDVTIYFHDEDAWPEPAGFWTRGGVGTRFTVVADSGVEAAPFRLHCGPVGNQGTIRRGRREERFDLEPGAVRQVRLGGGADPMLVTVWTTTGFVPAEMEAGSVDRRTLGCHFDPARPHE